MASSTPFATSRRNALAVATTSWQSLWSRILRIEVPGTSRAGHARVSDNEPDDLSRFGRTSVSMPKLYASPIDTADLTRWLYPLTPEEMSFREQVKALLAQPEFAPREGLTVQEQAELSYARFKRVRDALGLRVRDVEERPARLAAALELIGAVDGTLFTIMSIHYCLCGGSLLRHGSLSPVIDRYIDELDSLETIGTFLVTELGYGNNVVALQTRADYDVEREELIISTPSAESRKFMPNTGLAGVPKLGVVMARLFVKGEDHGVFPVVVRLRTSDAFCEGVSITPLGDKASYALDNAMTSFDRVRVPMHNLLLGSHSELTADGILRSDIRSRRERFLLSVEQVQLGRLCLSAVGATVTGASAFIAIKYAEQRRTFAPQRGDVSVLEYRNHQRDVFSALAYGYASRLMVNFALSEYTNSQDREHDRSFRITSATKAHVSYTTERFTRLCRERCGAAGLFEENRISAYLAQSPGLVTAEGDNHIVLIKIARQMLLQQGYERLAKSEVESGAFSDVARLLALMRERERRLLNALRRAMAPARLPGVNLFELWNENVNLAIEIATAHSSRLVAEAFWERAKDLSGDHPVIGLFKLFALQEIAPHLGFFLAEGLVTPAEVREHGKDVDLVCKTLRPFALELAIAIDVPNELLRTPIASDDYVACYDTRARAADTRLAS
jgi:acyl-CoA oxidase